MFVTTDVAGGSEIWWSPIDGGPQQRLLTVPFDIGRLTSGPGGLLAAEYNVGRFNLATPSADGSPTIIDPANGVTWSPAFAPDGSLAMGSNRAGEQGVWLMRPGGRGRLLLSSKSAFPNQIAWSPDGAVFAYVLYDTSASVRIATAAGQEVGRIPVPGTDAGRPAWVAGGRSLVFPVRDAEGWRIWRLDLGRSERPRPITGYGWASVRADGDELYGVRSSRPGVWRIGPPAVQISGAIALTASDAWTIFRHRVIYPDRIHLDHPRLLSDPIDGGPRKVFADLPNAAFGIDFAIDPHTGVPVYVDAVATDSDIELFHLSHR